MGSVLQELGGEGVNATDIKLNKDVAAGQHKEILHTQGVGDFSLIRLGL